MTQWEHNLVRLINEDFMGFISVPCSTMFNHASVQTPAALQVNMQP